MFDFINDLLGFSETKFKREMRAIEAEYSSERAKEEEFVRSLPTAPRIPEGKSLLLENGEWI